MDAAADVEQELFEVIKDSVLDMVSGVEYLHSKPSENTCYHIMLYFRMKFCYYLLLQCCCTFVSLYNTTTVSSIEYDRICHKMVHRSVLCSVWLYYLGLSRLHSAYTVVVVVVKASLHSCSELGAEGDVSIPRMDYSLCPK